MRRILRRVLPRLLLIGAALLLTFGLLEIGVRVIPLYPDRFITGDPELGWRFQPNAEGVWFGASCPREFTNRVRINDAGVNDVEHALEKPSGTRRVLVLGDSIVAALELPLEQAFFRRLEGLLNTNAETPYEVLAAGVSGYGTMQEWLLYERFGKPYDPDLVLLVFTPHNDFTDNHPAFAPQSTEFFNTRPYYTLQENGTGVITPSRAADMPFTHRFLLEVSSLYRLLVIRSRGFAPSDPVTSGGLQEAQAESYAITFALLDQIRQSVEAAGGQFAVVIDQSHISSADERTAIHALITEALDERGITSISLLEPFDSAQANGRVMRFSCDSHWTPEGHALAADELAPFVHRLFENAS